MPMPTLFSICNTGDSVSMAITRTLLVAFMLVVSSVLSKVTCIRDSSTTSSHSESSYTTSSSALAERLPDAADRSCCCVWPNMFSLSARELDGPAIKFSLSEQSTSMRSSSILKTFGAHSRVSTVGSTGLDCRTISCRHSAITQHRCSRGQRSPRLRRRYKIVLCLPRKDAGNAERLRRYVLPGAGTRSDNRFVIGKSAAAARQRPLDRGNERTTPTKGTRAVFGGSSVAFSAKNKTF